MTTPAWDSILAARNRWYSPLRHDTATVSDGVVRLRGGDRTTAQGGETAVIPDDFSDGDRFVEVFDGVGALLRFPID